MALPFQSSFQTFATDIPFPNILDAKFTALTVRDTTENEPTLLLEVDEPFAVEVAWSLSGVALCSIGGTWWVALFIDDIDGVGATSGALGAAAQIPVNGCQADYTTTFNIPANSVSPGVYQLVVTINHTPQNDANPNDLTENVGFAQSQPIKFTPVVKE
jgi:hypothetical protein